MPSQDHREAVARAIAVMRAVRDETDDDWVRGRLGDAVEVSQNHLTRVGDAPEAPDDIALDRPTVRSAVVSLDAAQERVGAADRAVLADAMGILDEYQEVLGDGE